jgi:tetratricopeptide (TPR) repeat protein
LDQAWYNKGNVLMNLRDYGGAIQAYNESHKLSPPGFPYTWYYKGIALDRLGRHKEAIQAYDKAIEIAPQMEVNPELIASGMYINPCGQMWNAKGFALQAIGRNIEAQAAFAKAKELGYTGPTFVNPDKNDSLETAPVPSSTPGKMAVE